MGGGHGSETGSMTEGEGKQKNATSIDDNLTPDFSGRGEQQNVTHMTLAGGGVATVSQHHLMM